jgi:hypothetical protein
MRAAPDQSSLVRAQANKRQPEGSTLAPGDTWMAAVAVAIGYYLFRACMVCVAIFPAVTEGLRERINARYL